MMLKNKKNVTSWLLCMMLIVAMAFATVGCSEKKESTPTKEPVATQGTKDNVLGEGKTKFTFTVVDKEGVETEFEINTDKEIVGDALMELDLLAGEDGQYGLYVKTVNGITADYDVDQTYWAFYVNGEYATAGVDSTKVEAGATYLFKVEK